MTLLTSYALLAAQIPVDETNAQSTIIVKKKEPPPSDPPPPPAEPPVQQVLPAVASPPPPPIKAAKVEIPVQSIQTERRGTKILPWITLAGSAVATGIGAFFAVRTGQKLEEQNELEFSINASKSRVNIPQEFTDNQRAVFINGITATVLISAGISGAIASGVALSMD